ncbi:hypothetical protein HK100_010358 [Physocladia obscura]|uniref:BAR-domain-containing protein n=1 Tax=Physocladia obscura TaxID=109957 RepID=A0AAD5T8J6_9FUNG|nr:hypothetical protein HK100_010358 [Physocladia obscura]
MPGMGPCADYVNMCSPKDSRVQQCKTLSAIPYLPTTKVAKSLVASICNEMWMDGCEKCFAVSPPPSSLSTNNNGGTIFTVKSCDYLAVYSGLCLAMPDMTQCTQFTQLCTASPLLPLCPSSNQTPQQPAMQMYFHFGIAEYILFKNAVPRTLTSYVFACAMVFLAAVLYEGLLSWQRRYERAASERILRLGASYNATANSADGESAVALLLPSHNSKYLDLARTRVSIERAAFRFVGCALGYAVMLIAMTFNSKMMALGVAAICVAAASLTFRQQRSGAAPERVLSDSDQQDIRRRLFAMLTGNRLEFNIDAFEALFLKVNRRFKVIAKTSTSASALPIVHGSRNNVRAENNKGIQLQIRDIDSAENETLYMAACLASNETAARMLESYATGFAGLGLFTATDASGATVLHRLVRSGNTTMMRLVLGDTLRALALASVRNTTTLQTPLMVAAALQSVNAIRLLLKRHADPAAVDRNAKDALMCCINYNNSDTAALIMLESSAVSVFNVDIQNKSALFYAINANFVSVVIAIVEKTRQNLLERSLSTNLSKKRHANYASTHSLKSLASTTSLSSTIVTVRDRDSHTLTEILNLFADSFVLTTNANVQSNNGPIDNGIQVFERVTPLLVAARLGFINIFNVLLDANSDTRLISFPTGNTILHHAVLSGNFEIVRLICEKISNDLIGTPNTLYGDTPFHLAAYLHSHEIISYFLSRTTLPVENHQNDFSQYPIHTAVLAAHAITASVTPNSANTSGLSSLLFSKYVLNSSHSFNLDNFLETVKVLIKTGSCEEALRTGDSFGRTPLDWFHQYLIIGRVTENVNTCNVILKMLEFDGNRRFSLDSANFSSLVSTEQQIFDAQNVAADVFRNLRVPQDDRRKPLMGDVSVEGFVQALRTRLNAKRKEEDGDGIVVVIGERAYSHNFQREKFQYGAKLVEISKAESDILAFYQSIHQTYSRLATEKQITPLFHSLLVELDSANLLSATFTTTVDGMIKQLELQSPVIELYGSVAASPRCLKCLHGIQAEVSDELFWTMQLPTYLKDANATSVIGIQNTSSKISGILCPRDGCNKGMMAPRILMAGEDETWWIQHTLGGGWGRTLKALEKSNAVILIGVTIDETVTQMLQVAPVTSPVLLIDNKSSGMCRRSPVSSLLIDEAEAVIKSGKNFRYVGLITENEFGGVDEGLRIFAQKNMSLKGFTKAVARLPHLVMAKSGYTSETVDPEFADLEDRFKLLDTSARKLSDDAKKFKDALSSLLMHQELFAGTLLEYYNFASLLMGKRSKRCKIKYKETDRVSLQAAQEFSNFAQSSRQTLIPDLETIERRLVAPAADLVGLLDNVKKVILKRSHKLLDFDRHRETVKKLKEKERTVNDEKSLGKAEVAFDQASREYNHINNILKQEIPILLQLKAPFIDPCFQTLYWYQLRVHQTLFSAYGTLIQLPAFDTSVSAAVGFESKVTAQAKLLDDITLLVKNRRSIPSNNPLSPDYVAPVSGVGGGGMSNACCDGQLNTEASLPAYISTGPPAQFNSSFRQIHSTAAPYGATPAALPYGAIGSNEKNWSNTAVFVTALYDYEAQAEGDLTFRRDDRIEVVERTSNPNDWWTGRLRGVTGIFPGNYVILNQQM